MPVKTKARTKQDSGGNVKGRALAYAVLSSIKKGEIKSRSALMREAGYAPSSIDAKQHRAWNSQGFKEVMAEAGLGLESIQKVLGDALNAKAQTAYQGEVIESNVADHKVRMHAVELAAKYTGLDVQRSQSININIDAQLDDAINSFSL